MFKQRTLEEWSRFILRNATYGTLGAIGTTGKYNLKCEELKNLVIHREFQKSIRRVDEEITLAKFLSELKLTEKDRVVIYDDSCNLVFDSDAQDLCLYFEMWEVLEETICRVSDVTENGKRTVYVFMTY